MYFLELDLGARLDHSAIAVVTGVDDADGPFDHVFCRQPVVRRMHVLHDTGMLGWVPDLIQMPPLAANCTVVADVTGVGLPVVEMPRESELGSTAGDGGDYGREIGLPVVGRVQGRASGGAAVGG